MHDGLFRILQPLHMYMYCIERTVDISITRITRVLLLLDYGNIKLTNQVARNAGSIFHSHLVSGIYSWPLARSIGIYWHTCF